MDYQKAALEQVAHHFTTASRQVVSAAMCRWKLDDVVLTKLRKAHIMAKIACLQGELEALSFPTKGTISEG